MKLSESLSFDVYNMHAKAGKWVFRAPEFILKRGVCGGGGKCKKDATLPPYYVLPKGMKMPTARSEGL